MFYSTGPVKKSTRNWYVNLFFNRRRPHLRAIPMEWEKPSDDDLYQRIIHNDGFISPKYWMEDDLNHFPIIRQDAEDLEDYLLSTYFEYSQKSKHYQDRYYSTQWAQNFGIFLTIVWGAIALLLLIPPPLKSFSQDQDIDWSQVFTIMAFFISGISILYSFMRSKDDPRANWIKMRRFTEALRSDYFKYLSHFYPFHKENRLEILIEQVTKVRLAEKNRARDTKKIVFEQKGISKRKSHETIDYSVLITMYRELRMAPQEAFYKSRVNENQLNLDFIFDLSLSSLVLATVLIALSIFVYSYMFLLLGVVLPAFASVLITFKAQYGWEKQTDIYRDALAGLENINPLLVQASDIAPEERGKYYTQLVLECENVFGLEVSQWGAVESGVIVVDQSESVITVEPMFGIPPSQPQFMCDIFMIMPFSIVELQPIYSEHIKPTIHELQIDIKRGDDFFSKHSIMDEVWAGIYHSKIVICECTGRNANVFYEIGIAHTIGKPAVMLAQTIDDIPFDLRHLRTIIYENTPEGMQKLRVQLKDAVEKLLPLGTLLQAQSKL